MTSHAELEQERIRVMGHTLGARYHALWTELVVLNFEWREFETLYAHSNARMGLLNKVAPNFFGPLRGTMWENTLLTIARITDPPKTGRKDNLTIQGLEEILPEALAHEVRELIAVAVRNCGFAKDWRNRRLAHNDLALKLNQPAKQLAAANRRDVREALDAIGRVLQRIHSKYFHSETISLEPRFAGGADALVTYLKLAVAAEQQREQ